MKRLLFIGAAGLALLAASPASADPTHTSCADFGALSATLAQQDTGLGGLVSGVATSGPNAVSGLIQTVEHPEFCAPK
jgi:hypothetical protein